VIKLQVHPPLSTAWRQGRVTAASFGGGHRMLDDRWVYPDPDRNDEAGKKLAILKGAARAADMTDDMFKAKFMVIVLSLAAASLQVLDSKAIRT
jgi:hypothetical protein